MVQHWLRNAAVFIIALESYFTEQIHPHTGNVSRMPIHGNTASRGQTLDFRDNSTSTVLHVAHLGSRSPPKKSLMRREKGSRRRQRERAMVLASAGEVSPLEDIRPKRLMRSSKSRSHDTQRERRQPVVTIIFASTGEVSSLEHADVSGAAQEPLTFHNTGSSKDTSGQKIFEAYSNTAAKKLSKGNSSNEVRNTEASRNTSGQKLFEAKSITADKKPSKGKSSIEVLQQRPLHDHRMPAASVAQVSSSDRKDGQTWFGVRSFSGVGQKGLMRKVGKHIQEPRRRRQQQRHDSAEVSGSFTISQQLFVSPASAPPVATAATLVPPLQSSPSSGQGPTQAAPLNTTPPPSANDGSCWRFLVIGILLGIVGTCLILALLTAGWFWQFLGWRLRQFLGWQPAPNVTPRTSGRLSYLRTTSTGNRRPWFSPRNSVRRNSEASGDENQMHPSLSSPVTKKSSLASFR